MADNISEKKYENPGLPGGDERSQLEAVRRRRWLFDTTIVHCEGAQWVRDDSEPDRLLRRRPAR